jgi:hypothetical protein
VATTTETHTETRFGPWSPAQLLVAAVGVFLAVIGGIALAQTSGFGEWTSPQTTVLGFGHTPLLAVIEIVVGLLIMAEAVSPWGARSTLVGFGVLFLTFGLIVWIEPGALDQWLGVTRESGILYTAMGGGAVLLGSVSPVVGERVHDERSYG